MAGITFVPQSTIIPSSWLNPINDFYYDLFQAAVTVPQARAALGIIDPTVVTETGTSRTLQVSDAEKYIVCTNSSPVTITIPSATFTAPTTIVVVQQGTGTVTIAADGVTLRCAGTPETRGQYSVLGILQTATGVFYVTGDFDA
jgi:hypothetical protein